MENLGIVGKQGYIVTSMMESRRLDFIEFVYK